MLSYKSKLILYFLKKSFDNDEYLDKYFRSLNTKPSKVLLNLPKFHKRTILFAKYGRSYILLEYFFYLFYPILVFFLFAYFIVKALLIVVYKKSKNYTNYDDIFFVNGEVADQIYLNYVNKIDINNIIVFNRSDIFSNTSGSISTLHFTFSEFLDSLKIVFIFIFKYKKYFHISFLAFEWLILFFKLNKVKSKRIHSFDHYDRFAVCVDSVSYFARKNHLEYNFHQHGDFHSDLNFSLPYRLKFVANAFLNDSENSLFFFNNCVLDKPIKKERIYLVNNSFYLTDLPNDFRFKILIIGNAYCINFHTKIINSLISKSNLTIYFKPHPNDYIYPKSIQNLQVINNKDFFPKVDLVFSYNSTLLSKYINLGVDYIMHELDSEDVIYYNNMLSNRIKF